MRPCKSTHLASLRIRSEATATLLPAVNGQRCVNSHMKAVTEKLQKGYDWDEDSNCQNIQLSWEGI